MPVVTPYFEEVSPLAGVGYSEFFLISTTEKERAEYKKVILVVIGFVLIMGVFVAVSFVVVGLIGDDDSSDDDGDADGIGSNREGTGGAYSGSGEASSRSRTNPYSPDHGGPFVPPPRPRPMPPLDNRPPPPTVPPDPAGGDQVAARLISASLNRRQSPCNNFYAFVCGRYSGRQTHVLTTKLLTGSKTMLANIRVPAANQRAVEKAAGLFQACKRLGSDARRSEVHSLKSFLSQLGLDMSNMPYDPNFDTMELITRLSLEYGFPTFFKIGYFNRPHLPNKILEMLIYDSDEKWLAKNHGNYDNVSLARYYMDYVRLYDPGLDATALVTRIIRGEYVVRRAMQNARNGPRSMPTFVSELGTLTRNYVSQDRWDELIRRYTGGLFAGPDVVVVWNDATALVVLLMDNTRLARGDSRLLMSWSLIHRLLPLVHGQSMMALARSLFFSQPDPIGDFCLQAVHGVISLPITKHFLRRVVPHSAVEAARQVAMNVKESLIEKLRNSSWIREPVWCLMNGKARNMRLIMAHPKELATDSLVEAFFAAFPSAREEFFGPYVESHRLLTTRIFKQNTTENFTSVAVNAYYQDSENKVTIPVGILQPPFFINGASSAFNYGALGQAIGHEIMHAFDANGITYSYRFTRHDLWNTPTMRQYKEKVLCLRASYQRAEAASRARTLSDNTDSEGFADFSGILLAYAAYQRLPDHLRTQMVPNVGLSADQIFFVSHCLKWCDSNAEPRRTPGSIYWAVRSRCIVPLQNMPEFANAFSCKPGDFMNPRDRCYFW